MSLKVSLPKLPTNKKELEELGAKAKEVKEKANKIKETATEVVKSAKELPKAVKALKTDGFQAATRNAWKEAVHDASNSTDKLTRFGTLKRVGQAGSAAASLVKLPGQAATAVKDIRDAVRTQSREKVDKAIDSSVNLAKDGLTTAKGALETARDGNKLIKSYRAATTAFRAELPNAERSLVRKVGISAAKAAFTEGKGATHAAVQVTSKSVVEASSKSVAQLAGTAERSVARASLRAAEKGAAHAAVEASAHAGAGALARAAGRFAPGVNVALAGYDTYQAYKDVHDPKASLGKKTTSVITAVSSVAAATNIPVVSQIGAGVSTLSSLAGGFFFAN